MEIYSAIEKREEDYWRQQKAAVQNMSRLPRAITTAFRCTIPAASTITTRRTRRRGG